MNAPIIFSWTDEGVMRPLPRFSRLADKRFVVGESYPLDEAHDRSIATHRHEFAWLREAWDQLPEELAPLYASPEHLRKRALIDCGYYTETIVDAGTNAAALRVAAYIRSAEEFSLVIVRRHIVCIRKAESQSRRNMGGKRFQESKTAILNLVSGLLGIAPETLTRHAGQAA